jgi:hypothetical protein
MRARRWGARLCAPALVLLALAGCRPGNAKERDMSASGSEIAVIETAETRGANKMRLSPDGRWMALEFDLPSLLPLLVRLDRRGEHPPAVARGIVGGPPRNDGTLYYVEQEAPDMSGSSDAHRSHLRRLGSPDRLLSLDGAYGSWLVGEDRLLMFGSRDRGPVELLLVDGRNGEVLARREPLAGLGPMIRSVVASGRIHILFDPSRADPPRQDGLIMVTVATDDLRELWRREGIKPTPMFSRPSLGTTAAGRTLLLVSEVSKKVVTFDAATGTPGSVLELPVASNVLRFVHEAVPREDALVLWIQRARGASSLEGWKMLAVRNDRIDVVVDRPRDLPPDSAAWDGRKVLLAPWGKPRSEDQPAEWEEPFASYMKLLDGASR